ADLAHAGDRVPPLARQVRERLDAADGGRDEDDAGRAEARREVGAALEVGDGATADVPVGVREVALARRPAAAGRRPARAQARRGELLAQAAGVTGRLAVHVDRVVAA